MEAQAAAEPVTSRVPLDEGVRTCRPAIVRQTRTEGADSQETPAGPDWNIIRGED
ncbi:hypothetical protein GCM10010302_43550 [Streptomyces polychromogenes]|uniref:Uncharacterized protein n=1 Tax=Streptomyces polychromogenes TaxID=67342 RepID=A0ABN0VHB0_9ACTN